MGQLNHTGSLRAYRDNLQSVVTLDRETERALALKWIDGESKAGEQIVLACLPFVISIALEYRRWGIPLEDIIQQGNLGLLRAAKKFDPNKECRLATYAAYWIRAEIREYVVRGYRVVRLGTTKGERRLLRVYRTTQETDVGKLAEASGLSQERIQSLLPLLMARESSLDATFGDAAPAVDRLMAPGASPEEQAQSNEAQDRTRESVRRAIHGLSDREKLIVQERLMNDEPITLQKLGELLGVSKERVRQLEERACSKLRSELQHLKLEVAS